MYVTRDGRYTLTDGPQLRWPIGVTWPYAAARGTGTPCWRFVLSKRLYVGNLSYRVTSSDLEALFAEFGAVVSAQVVTDRESGRSKGFGFVEMANDAEAETAIQKLNGQDHEGRPLTVNEAKPRESRGGGGRYGGGERGGRY